MPRQKKNTKRIYNSISRVIFPSFYIIKSTRSMWRHITKPTSFICKSLKKERYEITKLPIQFTAFD